jgi:hypothetical protein
MVNYRRQNRWEEPKTDVASQMTKDGYTDSWKAAGGPPDSPTCWANTRIDVRHSILRLYWRLWILIKQRRGLCLIRIHSTSNTSSM